MAKRLPRPKAGERFGKLRVVIPEGRNKGKRSALCVCDCGRITAPQIFNLRSGKTQSCGCLKREKVSIATSTHGMKNTSEYSIWATMKKRCNNPNHSKFQHYGARGIKVCDRWHKFENFYEDMGDKPEGMTLERKDNDKGYSPDNCIWATNKQQARNRRSNRLLTFNNETKCIAEWVEELGLKKGTILGRLNRGWDADRALTTPIRAKKT